MSGGFHDAAAAEIAAAEIAPLAGVESSELRRLAYQDHLTGLPNRTAFSARLHGALRTAQEHGRSVGLLFIDLDGFKLVNDTLGHSAGDGLLKLVADRLTGLGGHDACLARHGGDEFLVLCEELPADRADALEIVGAVAEDLCARLREPFQMSRATFEISASIGISVYPFDAGDSDKLIQHADQAMYASKRSGRGVATVFDGSEEHSISELEVPHKVRRALERGEFELHYQPVVEIADGGALGGLEALLRWRDPDRGGFVPPGEFLPYIADTPLLEEIGDWVFGEVCRQLVHWRRDDFAPRISFNIPAHQLRRPGFAEYIIKTATRAGADLSRLAAEITETGQVDLGPVVPTLAKLRDAGLVLSLDDFGTGYSSFSRLREMPFQLLKTDLSFMRGIPEDPQALELMQGMIALGKTLGMVVIVEGVETQEQCEALLSIGCRVAQGYLLGRPAPAEEIERVWMPSWT